MLDAVIIGGGAAGSTAARLLALWGYHVLLYNRGVPRPPLAETLPPSIGRLFALLGVEREVARAGWFRTTGNTSWWTSYEPRSEAYPDPGYQVTREELDGLLLELARGAGVEVCEESLAPGELPTARLVLDASGRAGVIARQGYRIAEPRYRTLAICAAWEGAAALADPSHTLIESYRDGWAWSVPVSPERRFVTVMINTRETRTSRGEGLGAIYSGELAKTRAFQKMLEGGRMRVEPWACDASLYRARRYTGPQHLLVGDAGSFVDPLSSFGVKKAMSSAWLAAVVVNTCLRRPEMAATALEYFDDRERQVYSDHLRRTAALFGEVARIRPHPFWQARSIAPEEAMFYNEGELQSALDRIRSSDPLRLRPSRAVRTVKRPLVSGREIVLAETLALEGLPRAVEYVRGVHLPTLLEVAGGARSIPELCDSYNACAPGDAGLPAVVSALALLVAKGILEIES